MKRMGIAKLYCLALVLALALGLSSAARAPRLRTHHVKFVNQLDNKVLNVNCKNEKPYIDLTLQILLPKQEYEFKYNVARGMNFRCDLRHGSTSRIFTVSDAITKRECGGNHCVWKAEDTGISLLNSKTNQYKFKYGWGN
ncbi:uncharacterized protein LOC121258578 [Juglans microcarpa x Juglans regia]|uniref:uncharacterized protein LOC121258578 n=1 Tax=Juglans microcarpa x Juglans regia TaxID=2249226 RepID=UPI001B7DD794|nr:uncharacterized protein LOC121258578 [Juglans microcarpa x Juglans regia]